MVAFGAGLVLLFDQTSWAIESPPAPDVVPALGRRIATEPIAPSQPGPDQPALPWLVAAAFQEGAALPEAVGSAGPDGASGSTAIGAEPAGAAPRVMVRPGDHGEFDRIVFEWPDAIEHHVEQRGQQVVVSFDRPGRIDLSGTTDRLGGRVVAARAEDGSSTSRVTLRVVPGAAIRSSSLEGRRIVVVDVFGETSAPALPQPASVASQESIQELRQALERRDAVIESLLARVEQLERNVALSRGELDRVIAGAARAAGAVGSAPGSQTAAAEERSAPKPSAEEPGAAPPGRPERQETAQAEPPAPGQFEVDEEAAERALDFTLVEEGALLLPLGRMQVTPSFTYTRETSDDFPVFVDPGGANLFGEQEVRRNEFEFAADLLVGLPLDSQLELGLPYNLVDQSIVTKVSGTEIQESSRTGQGLGDFSVGLAKTVLRERNWLPDVVLRANWNTGTGDRQNSDVPLGAGFQELTGSVSLIKRQDPLVFVGGGFYQWAYDQEDDIDPGDSYGFSIGTFLAASPNTSLSVVLNQSFGNEFEVAGQRIRGSDSVQSVLALGASAILTRNVLLTGAVGVGLTDDSPDYSVSLSLPIRFNTPGL